ncbi:hypothetical protein FHS83_001779 [Rhizomicrobium palustre]|uniref:Uncharacterized protein n=1 Tax=Rhizomicrobium palustre TaxID=189966 RepID=A0A846MZD5_9PROT|nr:hypothetical protein [Rhizomicrobium palustre]NIK88461.1 hypothetical protein [Rhizomicrobium palustre]
MGTLIRVIFREGVPRQRAQNRSTTPRRSALARERGLTLWRERDDLVIAAAYRVAPPAEPRTSQDEGNFTPLKFAPHS